jgi:hypothetical protein
VNRNEKLVPTKRYLLASVHYKASEVEKVRQSSFFLDVRKTGKHKRLVEGTTLVEQKCPEQGGECQSWAVVVG